MKVLVTWLLWLVLSCGVAFVLNYSMSGRAVYVDMDTEAERRLVMPTSEPTAIEKKVSLNHLILPGQTTHGHYQIELKCAACHITDDDGWGDVKQSACIDCHEEELDRVDDSHPVVKFKDVSKASMLSTLSPRLSRKNLESQYCITCHTEHNQETTLTMDMGLTIPADYCLTCHEDIYENRKTHVDFGFETCANAGCHNYHDNSALYEKFLVDHMGEPDMLPEEKQRVVLKDYSKRYQEAKKEAGEEIVKLLMADASHKTDTTGNAFDQKILSEWSMSRHAAAGVNCNDCHMVDERGYVASDPEFDPEAFKPTWLDKPPVMICSSCHEDETKGFLASKHGMRIGAGLSPMRPELGRLPFKKSAAHELVTCNSCHKAHNEDLNFAAVTACMDCHDDEHTKNYIDSPHHKLWQKQLAGEAPAGSGVSCATCHLPRVDHGKWGKSLVKVAHNQNDYIKPNEKMIRTSCNSCHGVEFILNALADEKLIDTNFDRAPEAHVESYDFIRQKLERRKKRK